MNTFPKYQISVFHFNILSSNFTHSLSWTYYIYIIFSSVVQLGDTLDGDCGADLAATARTRNGWMKFRELLPFLTSRTPPLEMKGWVYASCVRSSMTYGSETRPLLVMLGWSLKEQRCRWLDGCVVSHWKTEGQMKNWEGWLELSLSQLSLEVVDWYSMDMWWEKVMRTGWRDVWSIELKAEDRLEGQERHG